jgi:glucose uptake protein GlcU
MATESGPRRRTAGAFDIRSIIALLIGLYGLIITVLGLAFTSDAQRAKAAGVNINLWAGLAMLVFAALMVLWVVVRPLRVPAATDENGETTGGE